jgi:hypothetical protein
MGYGTYNTNSKMSTDIWGQNKSLTF